MSFYKACLVVAALALSNPTAYAAPAPESSAHATESRIGFKGILPGSTIEQVGIQCKRIGLDLVGTIEPDGSTMIRKDGLTAAEIPIKRECVLMQFSSGRLAMLTFDIDSSSFETMKIALASKYGKPFSRSVPVQNAFGAVRTNQILMWSAGENTVELKQFTDDIETSTVNYGCKPLMIQAVKNLDKRDAAKANDL